MPIDDINDRGFWKSSATKLFSIKLDIEISDRKNVDASRIAAKPRPTFFPLLV